MKQRVIFNEKQESYKYMPLGNGLADVFIREFIEEKEETKEEIVSYNEKTKKVDKRVTENTLFIYNQNEFRVDAKKVTEAMINANPLSYIDYDPDNVVEDENPMPTTEERLQALEDALLEIGGLIYND